MTVTGAGDGKLQIGQVIKTTFAVVGRNFAPFTLLALILSGLPTLIVGYLQAEAIEAESVNLFVLTAAGGLIALVAALVLQGALVSATVNDLNGRKIDVTEGLATGLRNFLPLLGLALLFSLAVGLGTLLLVVPGVMIALAWCVAAPVLIAERKRLLDTFGRSATLTRGNRWRILGLFLLYFLVAIAIATALGLIGLAGGMDSEDATSPVVLAVNTLSNVLSGLIGATLGAVLYVELRRLKEGVGPEGIAAVFD